LRALHGLPGLLAELVREERTGALGYEPGIVIGADLRDLFLELRVENGRRSAIRDDLLQSREIAYHNDAAVEKREPVAFGAGFRNHQIDSLVGHYDNAFPERGCLYLVLIEISASENRESLGLIAARSGARENYRLQIAPGIEPRLMDECLEITVIRVHPVEHELAELGSSGTLDVDASNNLRAGGHEREQTGIHRGCGRKRGG
jgi:hypothetical protein